VKKTKIVIVGYRASGKSTLGGILSARLGWPLLDIDRGIEQRAGCANLAEYYLQVGEEGYRPLETEIVMEMCSRQQCVISFGAGTLQTPANRDPACRDAFVVYLRATAQELWRRMEADPNSATTRPNLAGGGLAEVIEKLGERAPVYEQCADLIVDATQPSEVLADQIVQAFASPSTTAG